MMRRVCAGRAGPFVRVSISSRVRIDGITTLRLSFTRRPVHTSLLLTGLLLSFSAHADEPYIAVVEKVARAVAFFSEDGKQLAQVKVGNFPHEAALNGRLLYGSKNGIQWRPGDVPCTTST